MQAMPRPCSHCGSAGVASRSFDYDRTMVAMPLKTRVKRWPNSAVTDSVRADAVASLTSAYEAGALEFGEFDYKRLLDVAYAAKTNSDLIPVVDALPARPSPTTSDAAPEVVQPAPVVPPRITRSKRRWLSVAVSSVVVAGVLLFVIFGLVRPHNRDGVNPPVAPTVTMTVTTTHEVSVTSDAETSTMSSSLEVSSSLGAGELDDEYLKHAREAQATGSWRTAEGLLDKVQDQGKRDAGLIAAANAASQAFSWTWVQTYLDKVTGNADAEYAKHAKEAASAYSWSWAESLLAKVQDQDVRDAGLVDAAHDAMSIYSWSWVESFLDTVQDQNERHAGFVAAADAAGQASAWSWVESFLAKASN